MAFTSESRDKAAVTRQQQKEAARDAEKATANGIGESRIFAAAEGTFEDNPLLGCHLGGVKIADMPDTTRLQILSALTYRQTDEGIAAEQAANEGKLRPSGVTIGAEPYDKALEQRRDDVRERGREMYEARDPLKEVADQYAAPGMKAKFLSGKRVKDNGGAGDYQVVKDGKGDPVTVKGMVLGHMPEERASARNRFYRERSSKLLGEIAQRYKDEGGATAVVEA